MPQNTQTRVEFVWTPVLFLPPCGLRRATRWSSPRLHLFISTPPAAAPQPMVPFHRRSQAAQPASPGRSLQQPSAALLPGRENKRSKCPSLLKKTLVKGNQEAENSQSIRGSFTRFRFGGQEERERLGKAHYSLSSYQWDSGSDQK